MAMSTDNPIISTREDKFNFKRYAEVLAREILETEELPFCIGIFGSWGSGKTSFMNMLKETIGEQAKSIWFNPWKYDRKEDLQNALLQTILAYIVGATEQEVKRKQVEKLAEIIATLSSEKAMPILSAGPIPKVNVDSVINTFGAKGFNFYKYVNEFEENFDEAVKHCTKEGRLVVFIDDLDRCLPENAITVLEALKLFIGHARCVFILGMDHTVVEQGLKHRYFGGRDERMLSGREYLDKIIQVPFFLPPVPFENLKTMLSTSAGKDISDEIWGIICVGMDGNPRKTKRFVNSFSLLRRFLRPPDPMLAQKLSDKTFLALTQSLQDIYLAMILTFEMRFPLFYHHLRDNPGDWEYLETDIIPENDGSKLSNKLEKREALNLIWKKEIQFQYFMRHIKVLQTANYRPPSEEMVSMLLQTITLVADIGEQR